MENNMVSLHGKEDKMILQQYMEAEEGKYFWGCEG